MIHFILEAHVLPQANLFTSELINTSGICAADVGVAVVVQRVGLVCVCYSVRA